MKRRALVLGALLLTSCGGGSPAGPTQVASVQVAGTWAVQTSLTTVSGAQTAANCVLENLRTLLPVSSAILQMTQSGANLNATSQDTLPNGGGAVTTYTGTAAVQTITLNYKNCDLCGAHGVTCPTGVVDVIEQDDSILANLNGSTLTGSESITYSMDGVGIAKASLLFTATRQ